MIIKEFNPSTGLKKYIKSYIILEDSEGLIRNRRMSIFPSGHMEMIINYGDEVIFEHPYEFVLKNAQGYLGGQIMGPVFYRSTASFKILSVIFKPAGVFHLFHIPQDEFTNYKIKLDLIFGSEFIELIGRLCEAGTHNEIINIVDKYFVSLNSDQSVKSVLISEATRIIEKKGGIYNIGDLSEELDVNIKTLERHFRKIIGISPKEFSRIIRFNRVFNLLNTNRNIDVMDALLSSGFYDQSHFIRQFKQFTHLNPSDFLNKNDGNPEYSIREMVKI